MGETEFMWIKSMWDRIQENSLGQSIFRWNFENNNSSVWFLFDRSI